ncbi:hypothetical protein PENTCL1PPCAC_22741 [Pristionchus entomophagus]|uniref:Large ribosomal subunit protein mL64 n=1 Tax=Pristionchus entomophagus TaxID=358040 RepID=A0AAV5U290_9BILA|nr:hypothetical protein PENTCL1PPCAC_22741 [Pristionchus entomophagus]
MLKSLPESVTRLGMYHGLRHTTKVDLSSRWPSVEEVEREKTSTLFTPHSIVREQSAAMKQSAEKKHRMRLEKMMKNEKNYGVTLEKYLSSQQKAEKEKDEKDAVLERRMREIHEYFGYWMDSKDPRFELLLSQKEAQEKKAEKMAKRAELVKKKIAEVM